jgi:outer membrane protein OmpA-like peptidoglycan-associated protein
MKTRIPLILSLAVALVLPVMSQQASAPSQTADSAQVSQPTSIQNANSDQDIHNTNSDQNMSARQPLEPDYHQGFWGKLNPFARKKYVQRQLSPINNRLNELDDLTAENARQIKDVDARAQQGISMADAKAGLADQHAIDAGNRAQQANSRLNTMEQVVGNLDQYHPATQTEIRFRPGQTTLSPKAKDALDDMTADLKDQKGYIIEVQGFSSAGIQSSQAMANSVVRYLVEKNQVPMYRIFTVGLGNARLPAADDGNGKPVQGNRVEISLLKNNVDQLQSMNQAAPTSTRPAMQSSSSGSGAYSTSKQPLPAQSPSNNANNPTSVPAGSAAPSN